MSINPGHQPERFMNYTLLKGGRGFTIKTKFVYTINSRGGFRDEYYKKWF